MDPELVQRFFQGKCSSEEVHQILIWINSKEGEKLLENSFRDFEPDTPLDPDISDDLLKKIRDRAAIPASISLSSTSSTTRAIDKASPHSKKWNWKTVVGVGVAAVAILGFFGIFSRFSSDLPQGIANHTASSLVMTVRQTGPGERLRLKLQDGTEVILNSESKVEFPKEFGNHERVIFLEGGAFFEVTRDENRPFVVHSKFVKTTVLGTSFAVEEDRSAKTAQVAVLTGRVNVTEQADSLGREVGSVLLDPFDAAVFDAKTGGLDKSVVGYEETFAWKDGLLVFSDENFAEIIQKLEKWYGVRIECKKKISHRKGYSGRFQKESLENILVGLAFTYDFKFDIKDSKVVIY